MFHLSTVMLSLAAKFTFNLVSTLGEHLKARRLLLEPGAGGNGGGGAVTSLLASPAAEDAWQLVLEHPEQADPAQGGPAHAILIAVECLAMLNRLPDAVEALTTELQGQLFQIMSRTTHHIIGEPFSLTPYQRWADASPPHHNWAAVLSPYYWWEDNLSGYQHIITAPPSYHHKIP
jgi:hypothetical protein